jgi:hypothetical protein
VGLALSTLVAAVALLGVGVGSVAAAPPTEDGPTAAGYGSAWLAEQLDVQIPMENFGAPDWGVTLDAALGMAATGVGGTQIDAVWAALVAQRDAALSPGGVDSPGRLGRAILLAVALGEDPTSVGAAPGADLVARLVATMQTTGPDAGLFGSTSPLYDGAFRQGYALAGLVAAGVTPDQRAVDWLLAQQCGPEAAEGAWMPYRSDLSVPCAFDPALFVGPDTNATSAAISGLTAVGAGDDAVNSALDWLDAVQRPDGGWEQLAGYGTDPNSTALVIQALVAAGAGDDERFADQSASPLGALLSFQLGCDVPEADRGAFTFPGSNDAPNGFATAQAVPAAAGAPVLFEPGEIVAGVPALDCTPPTSTTTTTVPSTTSSTVAPTTSTVPPATSTTGVPTTVELGPAVTVVAPRPDSAEVLGATQSPAAANLALTGSSSLPLAAGAVLLLSGVALLAGARRRDGA